MSHRTVLMTALAGLLVAAPLAGQVGSPAGAVPVDALDARRARALAELDGALAVFGSARLRDIESDYPQDSDFRQDNDFFYLTGLEAPEGWLLLGDRLPGGAVLYLPERDPRAERWTGPTIGPGPEAVELTGIGEVRSVASLLPDLQSLGELSDGAPEPDRVLVSIGDGASEKLIAEGLASSGLERGTAAPLMARLRLIKDEEELRRLRRAIDITVEAHREAWRVARPGVYEFEVEAAIEFVFRAMGAERVGFPSIVGSGPNSTILHYDKNRRKTAEGDLVVADIGAEFGYYTADVTRTFPVSGSFTPRQRAVYELVLGAQEEALSRIAPGVTIGELTREARTYIDRHSGDLCGGDTCNRYFIHGLSHWLGMDVHDVGDYGTPLEPGMVLTIEPGLYLPDEALGVRIEDDVLVTEDGYELLTGALPRTPRAIEEAMAEEARWTRTSGGT